MKESLNSRNEIFIGVCYHRPAPILENKFVHPIHVGKALSNSEIGIDISDDTGNNISEKNKSWCELTALYWMRHNVDADYLGLMHYRRLLSFARKAPKRRVFECISDVEIAKFGWSESDIKREIQGWDIITASPMPTYPPSAAHRSMDNRELYAHQHHIDDLDLVADIIRQDHPAIYPFFIQVMTSRQMFYGNITVMKRDYFHDYCDFLFDVLEKAEGKSDISDYDSYQSRIWGFLAERLTNVYVAYAQATHGAKVKSLPVVSGIHPRPKISTQQCLDIAYRKIDQQQSRQNTASQQTVDIILAFDDNYTPHGATAMKSVLATAQDPTNLHFHILCSQSLTQGNRDTLRGFVTQHGSSISFYDVDEKRLLWLPLNRGHISVATYYRLLITELLPNTINKAVYMDADVICVEAIENLYEVDLGDNIAAGAPDEGGIIQSRRLRLPVSQSYVNAGILLFNIAELRKVDIRKVVTETIFEYGDLIILQDQDLLNIIFSGRIKILPLKWNIGLRAVLANELDPAYSQEEALLALQDPAIIHFTDRVKPWSRKSRSPYTALYYHFRQMTPWRLSTAKLFKQRLLFWLRSKSMSSERRFNREIRSSQLSEKQAKQL